MYLSYPSYIHGKHSESQTVHNHPHHALLINESLVLFSTLTSKIQIVLDECHKAKNLVPSGSSKPTKTGKSVLELQEMLPKARVVYCSATGIVYDVLSMT